MHKTLRTTLLASIIGLSLGTVPVAIGDSNTQVARAAEHTYLIEFAEPGLVAHARESGAVGRFQPNSTLSVAYKEVLKDSQATHKAAIASALGLDINSLDVTHHYLATHSGIAVRLTADQAKQIRSLDGVVSVEQETIEQLDTFRGPTFIGADSIWNGSATPSGAGTEGQGVVIGILDTGTYSNPVSAHPSFANTAACGHSAANPKVLSVADCGSSDTNGRCNGSNPWDDNGHGSHTASTAGGNYVTTADSPGLGSHLPSGYTAVSGVAPCATLRTYKVCPGSSCSGSAIQAGMDTVLLDGDVDVINFSISGGTSPWNDNDRKKLDLVNAGVFVAASAGNNSQADPSVVGRVGHRGPWVMTVASSTHDENGYVTAEISGPALPPPPGTDVIVLNPGSTTPAASNMSDAPVRWYDGHPAGAEGCTAFPANYFDNAVAVVRRGSCAFADKINNAYNAGAEVVIIGNNEPGGINMDTTGAVSVPAYSTSQFSGDAVVQYITENPDATLNVAAQGGGGDILSSFSYRGPTPGTLANLTKPDITAPGDNILAAGPSAANQWIEMGGTSMSGPHVAGAAALVIAANPDWTPMQVKSAMMMTAKPNGTSDEGGPWDIDDVGSGRVELSRAALAGFVLDETYANMLAANPSGGTVDVRDLNIPALRDLSCSPNCSWTRTVTSTLASSAEWTATFEHPEGVQVSVSPAQFTLAAGATQTLTFTATPTLGEPGTAIRFGRALFNTTTPNQSPQLDFTVAVRGAYSELPSSADLQLAMSGSPDPVENGGQLTYTASVLNAGPDDANNVSVDFTLPSGASYIETSGVHTGMTAPGFAKYPFADISASTAWTCTETATQSVSCALSAPLDANTTAPALSIVTSILLDDSPTTITASATVNTTSTDPDLDNNTVEVQTEVTGGADLIFADGFDGEPESVTVEEGFDDVGGLADAGWLMINNASTPGSTTWFQGNQLMFQSHQGAPRSYIAADFNSVATSGTISTWLLSPEIRFSGDSELRFWTRTTTMPANWADNLQVRVCTAMPCTNVGAQPEDVGAFGTMVLEVNPGQTTTGYPAAWTEYVISIPEGLPASGKGRIGFRYFVVNGGSGGTASNYIGIDSVSITAAEINSAGEDAREWSYGAR